MRRYFIIFAALLLSCSSPARDREPQQPYVIHLAAACDGDGGATDAAGDSPAEAAMEASSEAAADSPADVAPETSSSESGAPSPLYALGTGNTSGNQTCNGCLEQVLTISWSPLANQPPHSAFLASGTWDPTSRKFFFFGNTDAASQAMSYDPSAGLWANLAPTPNSTYSYGTGQGFAAAAGGKLYFFGGFNSGTNGIKENYRYDPTTDKYTKLTSSVVGVGDNFGAVVGSFFYFGGGCANNDGPGTADPCQSSWYRYDPTSDTRTALASLPVALGEAAAAALGAKIYVVGGYLGPAGETVGTTGVYVYDVTANTWSQKNPYPIAVAGACAAVRDGNLWVVGGWGPSGFPSKTSAVYSYNPAADTWAQGPPLVAATPVSVCGTGL